MRSKKNCSPPTRSKSASTTLTVDALDCTSVRGRSSMVEPQPSKLIMPVRSRSAALSNTQFRGRRTSFDGLTMRENGPTDHIETTSPAAFDTVDGRSSCILDHRRETFRNRHISLFRRMLVLARRSVSVSRAQAPTLRSRGAASCAWLAARRTCRWER
jgi:hypothetical protein